MRHKIKSLFSGILAKIFLIVTIITTIMSVLIIYILINFNHSTRLFVRNTTVDKSIYRIHLLEGAFSRMHLSTIAALTGIYTHDLEQVTRNKDELAAASNEIKEAMPSLILLLPKYKTSFEKIDLIRETAYSNAMEILDDAEKSGIQNKFSLVKKSVESFVDNGSNIFATVGNEINEQQKISIQKANDNFIKTRLTVIIVSFVIILFFIYISVYFGKLYFVNPLFELNAGAKKISDGNFTHVIHLPVGGEFSELARQFNFMALKLNKVYQEQEEKINIRTKDLVAANKHKSEFLANMSHELRTPLNAIIGFSEIMGQEMFGELNSKQKEYTNDIANSGKHLLSLINDILDLSKVEAGRMELHQTTVDMNHIVPEAISIVNELAKNRSINLIYSPVENLRHLILDERKIKQIILNLISNAIKFTPENGTITIKTEDKEKYLEVSITDTGIGISPEDQKKLFQSFRQVGTDITRKAQGSGLGLALAKQFVELHGGRIWVRSEINKGTSFIFSIPFSAEHLSEKKT